jgi:hypothetical protein
MRLTPPPPPSPLLAANTIVRAYQIWMRTFLNFSSRALLIYTMSCSSATPDAVVESEMVRLSLHGPTNRSF